jgi:hypothetical protein
MGTPVTNVQNMSRLLKYKAGVHAQTRRLSFSNLGQLRFFIFVRVTPSSAGGGVGKSVAQTGHAKPYADPNLLKATHPPVSP